MLEKITIRLISKEDNDNIACIIKNTLIEFDGDKPGTAFGDASLLDMFAAYQDKKEAYFVALINNEIVGGCGIKVLDDDYPEICELQKMYISPIARGKKIGKKLLDVCLDFAKKSGYKKCYLETFDTMYDAIKLYKKNNFHQIEKPIGKTGHNACNTWLLKDFTIE